MVNILRNDGFKLNSALKVFGYLYVDISDINNFLKIYAEITIVT